MPTIAPPESTPAESPVTQHAPRRAAHVPSPVGLVGRLTAMRRGLAGTAFLALGAAAWWWLTTHHFGSGEHESAAASRPPINQPAVTAPDQDVVVLPPTSESAANIGLTPVDLRPIRDLLTVPGRLDYDARSRLDYASPVDGIVSRVFVTVRQKVTKGDSLAEVSSPDVGMARDDIRKREDDCQIAKKAADWAAAIADNVEFQDRLLGAYREKILGSYSRLLFVEKVNASAKQLGEGGVLSGRIIEERMSNLEVAKANFTATCEEALFMTRQDRDRAKAALEQAERLVRISKEHLRTLVGSKLGGETEAVASGEELPPDSPEGAYDISSLVLRTPFDGVVEDIFVARGERVRAGDRLFVVADTSTLWVRAQIHERQWTMVEVSEGQEVRVNVPGAGEHHTTARINHVGATVEAESRSVPLVAELKNDDAHYKPGMFVWVDLPQGELREALAVPAAAIVRHEGKAFVFVSETAGRFRRVDVETGITSGDLVEVKKGLQAGQQVVSRGAFLLKSELLLEDED